MGDGKDENIIELTEVVEESSGAAEGGWMDTAPPPPVEKKIPEAPRAVKRDNPRSLDDLPDSPLKKFLVAEEEITPPAAPPGPGPAAGSAPMMGEVILGPRKSSEPPRPAPEPLRPPSQPPRIFSEPPRPAPEAARAPEPPRPSVPNLEAEMRALREAMLARVEQWVAQEGPRIIERVARDIFPPIAQEVIRKEIEKLKKEAEEKD